VGVGLLFVTVNGRMVAGTALVTAAALVGQRGAFLALNSAVQSAAIGVSTLVGAMLIGRNPDGSLAHAWHAALAAALAGALSVWLAVRVHRATHFTPTSHAQP
jgi:nicotinic acid phosphoribosyltransferase